MSKPAEKITGYRRLKDPRKWLLNQNYHQILYIKVTQVKWFWYNSPILNQLLEKRKQEKIGRGFEKDLEMRNRTAGNWKDKERLIYQKNV